MDPRTLALLLLVVGAVCLPAPIYLGWAAATTAPPPQTSQIYVAEPLDPTNRSDRATIVGRYGSTVSLSVHQVSDRYSAGEYRAPNETRRTLTAAIRTGTARTDDPDARADLRGIARNTTFVYDAYDDRQPEAYYRLQVREDGAVVHAEQVSRDRVANVTVERGAYRYATLSPGARRTVDRIVANSSSDTPGHRPLVSDPFVDRLPALVEREDTLYGLYASGHVDDFGPGFSGFLYGLVGTGLGVASLLLGGGIYGVVWWRQRSGRD